MSETTSPLADRANKIPFPIPTQFDAKAQQRVPIKVEYGGEHYIVEHVFDSYDNEDRMADYADRCKTILRSGDVKGAVERESDSFEANVWLWNKLAVGIDGMGEEEELPEDWKDRIDDEDKNYSIQQLLGTEIVPLETVEKGSGKRLPWGYKTVSSLIRLRVRFGAYQVVTEHHLKMPDPKQSSRFQKLMSRRQHVAGSRLNQPDTLLPSRARDLGRLYKELMESVSGYVDDIVPLNHQVDVIIHHMSGGQEGIIKN